MILFVFTDSYDTQEQSYERFMKKTEGKINSTSIIEEFREALCYSKVIKYETIIIIQVDMQTTDEQLQNSQST